MKWSSLLIILIVCSWLITIASMAVHLTISATSDNYNDWVKGIGGVSIAVGAIGIILAITLHVKFRD